MSLRPLGCTALAVAIAATVSAGEIRGRVLVDGKPDARACPSRSRRRRREPTAPSC